MEKIEIHKVHCLFEQSGTFKREFVKMGIPAEDYDIQNNFGETDHVCDLFAEIEAAYGGGVSVFDTIRKDDIVFAFFPCIYFCDASTIASHVTWANYKNKTDAQRFAAILRRNDDRGALFGAFY